MIIFVSFLIACCFMYFLHFYFRHLRNNCLLIIIIIIIKNGTNFNAPDAHDDNLCFFDDARGQNNCKSNTNVKQLINHQDLKEKPKLNKKSGL